MTLWQSSLFGFYLISISLFIYNGFTKPSLAQVAPVATAIHPDDSLNTTVSHNGPVHTIMGGAIHGSNLFHSFSRFDVGAGNTAQFIGPSHIENILSRVTSPMPSMIHGTLQSDILGANLFLMNPSGILFGTEASLDISGSFHISTSDFIRLSGDGIFYASLKEASLFSTALPSAFGFLRESPEMIVIQGSQLTTSVGETLSVVGGNIEIIDGQLIASEGRIQLSSLDAPGTVLLDGLKPDAGQRINFGDIEIRGATIAADTSGSGDAGRIEIEADGLRLSDKSVIQTNSLNEGTGNSGVITIDAGVLTVEANSMIRSAASGVGNAGDVRIRVEALHLTDGGLIAASIIPEGGRREVVSSGAAGSVRIEATERIRIEGVEGNGQQTVLSSRNSRDENGRRGRVHLTAPVIEISKGASVTTEATGAGPGSDIVIDAARLVVAESGQIRSGSDRGASGRGGVITINATEQVIVSQAGLIENRAFGSGNAGAIQIHTGNLILQEQAVMTTSGSNRGQGDGGSIEIHATTVTVESRARISSTNSGKGAAGQVELRVGRLHLATDGQISVSVLQRSGEIPTAGDSGSLIISASDQVVIDGRGGQRQTALFGRNEGRGEGGNIRIRTRELMLLGGGRVTAESTGTGNAGNIEITVAETFLIEDSEVSTNARLADGGNVSITANIIQLRDSRNVTSVGAGEGQGGNIRIDARLGLLERSEIRADAFGGPGGNITIQMSGLISDVDSLVSASSEQSVDGTIDIQGLADLSGSLTPIEQPFANVGTLLVDRCANLRQGDSVSRLIQVGRDRIPTSPDGVLASPLREAGIIVAPHGGLPGLTFSAVPIAMTWRRASCQP